MMKKIFLIIVAAFLLFGAVQTSQAALTAVDPGPYTAATGYFPLYYTDGGLLSTTLDLCLSKAVSSRVPGALGAPSYMCTLLPNPGIFDDTLPIVFPINWPDEAFWFTGDATIVDAATEIDLTYVSAIEAAFGGGIPLVGDQVSFARIRIRVDVPAAGTYTITHPYGVETFNVTTPGGRAINMTRDIGIGAPGVFTGALAGDIGPFLRRVGPLYTETNPDTGAPETFVGDPNLLEPVTGSPFGNNFVRVQCPNCVPAIDVQTDLFAVSGRIWSGVRPATLDVDRSTYSRTKLGQSQVNVFATSPAPGAALSFRDALTSPASIPMVGDGTGKFYGEENPTSIPSFVIVTASAPSAIPTPLASPVVDVIKITRAAYALDTNTLLIEATSSDKFAPLPTLRAIGFGTLTSDAVGFYTLNASPVAQPPARVTVISTQGGSDTEPVQIVPTINIAPVAANDTASTTEGVAVVINVVGNDTDLGGAIVANSIALVPGSGPAIGNTVDFNFPSAGQVTYTPNLSFFGTDTFRYTVLDNAGLSSNEATVTVRVNGLPIANGDSASTPANSPINIAVLGNDSDPDGNLPLTVANLTQPASGTAVIVNNTTVTYTPAAGFTGQATFTYQARDSLGALSNLATVTVTVTAETITATAQARVRRGVAEWTINGTTNVPTGNLGGNVITVRLNSINGQVIGQAVPDNRGRWKLTVKNSTIIPVAGDRIAVTSRYTATPVTFPITIR